MGTPIRLTSLIFNIRQDVQRELLPDIDMDKYYQIILKYLQTKTIENITGISSSGSIHTFKLSSFNKQEELNSNYLSKGAHSIVFLIEEVLEGQDKPLMVLKIRITDMYDEVEQEKWVERFYESKYIFQKNKYGNSFADCLYYGLQIQINPDLSSPELNGFLKNHSIEFDIYKYYSPTNLIVQSLKFCSLLYYATLYKHFIYDLKKENVVFDENSNPILIDFDENIIKFYEIDKVKIIAKIFSFSYWTSCYFKKKCQLLLKDGRDYETLLSKINKIKKSPTDFDSYMATRDILFERIGASKIDEKKMGFHVQINYDFQLDKGNSLSFADIILQLFFESAKTAQLLLYEDPPEGIALYDFDKNSYPNKMLKQIMCTQNINDVDKLNLYVSSIKPRSNISNNTVTNMRYFLLDKDTECGILACDYELIPPFLTSFRLLMSFDPQFKNSIIYSLLAKYLKEVIGKVNTVEVPHQTVLPISVMDKEADFFKDELNKDLYITDVGNDVMLKSIELEIIPIPPEIGDLKSFLDGSPDNKDKMLNQINRFEYILYLQWTLLHFFERHMNRPEYRSDANIQIPPVGSNSPQSNIGDIIKWIKLTEDINILDYVETISYLDFLFSQISSLTGSTHVERDPNYLTSIIALEMIQNKQYDELARQLVFEIQYKTIKTTKDKIMDLILQAIPLKGSNLEAKVKYITCLYHRLTKSESRFKELNLLERMQILRDQKEIGPESIVKAKKRKDIDRQIEKLKKSNPKSVEIENLNQELIELQHVSVPSGNSTKYIQPHEQQQIEKLLGILSENETIYTVLRPGNIPNKLNPEAKSFIPLSQGIRAIESLDKSSMYSKYLKYKLKYLELKKQIDSSL